MYHPVNITEKARGHYNFLQHFVESGRAQLRGVIDKKFISCSFSRHAKTHASMVLVIWLNENVDKGYAIRDVAKLTGKGIFY